MHAELWQAGDDLLWLLQRRSWLHRMQNMEKRKDYKQSQRYRPVSGYAS